MADKTITFTSTGFPSSPINTTFTIPYFTTPSDNISNTLGKIKSISYTTWMRRASTYTSGTEITLIFFKKFTNDTGWSHSNEVQLRFLSPDFYRNSECLFSTSNYENIVDGIVGTFQAVPSLPTAGNIQQTFTFSNVDKTIGDWIPNAGNGETLYVGFLIPSDRNTIYFGTRDKPITHTLSITYEDTSPSTFTLSSTKDLKDKDTLTATISQQNTQCSHSLSFYKEGGSSPFSTWNIPVGNLSETRELSAINSGVFKNTSDIKANGYVCLTTYLNGIKIGETNINVSYLSTVQEDLYDPIGAITVAPSSGSPNINTENWVIKLTNVRPCGLENNNVTFTSWNLSRTQSNGDKKTIASGTTSSPPATISDTGLLKAGVCTWTLTLTNDLGKTKTISYSLSIEGAQTIKPSGYVNFNNIRFYRTDVNGKPTAEGTFFKIEGEIVSSSYIDTITLEGGGQTFNIYNRTVDGGSYLTYDLSKVSTKYTGSSDYKASITFNLKATNIGKQSYSNSTLSLQSAQYMLFFKKNGLALGIGKVVTEDNFLDIGWRSRIDASNTTPLVIKNNAGGWVSIDFRSYNDRDMLRMGAERYMGVNTRLFYVDIYDPTETTDTQTGTFLQVDGEGRMSFNGSSWNMLETSGGQFWINTHPDNKGMLSSEGADIKGNNTYIFKKETQESSIYDVLRQMDFTSLTSRLFNSQSDTPVTGLWIRDTNTARLFLQPKNTNTSIIGEVLIDSNSTTSNEAGLRFRNSSTTNYGLYYDEYIFPPRTTGAQTNTYTIYALGKNVFYDNSEKGPTVVPKGGGKIAEGSIWLKPVS